MIEQKASIKEVNLVCPFCKTHPFVFQKSNNSNLLCIMCKRQFGVWESKPSFLHEDVKELNLFWNKGFSSAKSKNQINKILLKIYTVLKAPRIKFRPKPHYQLLSKIATKGPFKALFIGYNQYFEDRLNKDIIQIDVVPKEFVDIVAMGESVPFPEGSFDLVVISGVIEHTQYPLKVVDEAHRVLKTGEKLYLSSPWVYPFHGGDNYRFSHEGLRLLCHQFKIIEIGSLDGPLHALGIFLYYLIVEYLSFGNRYLRYGLSIFVSWLVYPFMLFDALTVRQIKSKCILDANIYAIVEK